MSNRFLSCLMSLRLSCLIVSFHVLSFPFMSHVSPSFMSPGRQNTCKQQGGMPKAVLSKMNEVLKGEMLPAVWARVRVRVWVGTL